MGAVCGKTDYSKNQKKLSIFNQINLNSSLGDDYQINSISQIILYNKVIKEINKRIRLNTLNQPMNEFINFTSEGT
jgi:hypothetical protein